MEIKRDPHQNEEAMKPIRMRASLPDFDDNTYNTYRNFKEVLKRETSHRTILQKTVSAILI